MKKMLAEYDSYVGEVKTYEIILQNSEDVCKVNWSVCHVAVYVCRDALENANEKICKLQGKSLFLTQEDHSTSGVNYLSSSHISSTVESGSLKMAISV